MKEKNSKIPKIPYWVLKKSVVFDLKEGYIGDIEEEFSEIQDCKGRKKAVFWLWFHAFISLFMVLKYYLSCGGIMFKSYLKIAVRNILKNKAYSFIVIIGFSIGLACFLLIFLWTRNEFSYDNFHSKSDRIYKVDADCHFENRDVQIGMQTNYTGPMLNKDLPEIEKYLRLYRPFETSIVRRGKDKVFREDNIVMTDKNFFDFFDFPLKLGDRNTALNDPSSVVISTDIAKKIFPADNPLGKNLEINQQMYTVTGVTDIKAFNSHINFDFLIGLPPFSFNSQEFQNLNLAYLTYILLKENTDADFLQTKVKTLVKGYIKPIIDHLGIKNLRFDAFLMPLKDVYLHTHIDIFKTFRTGSLTNIYIMLAIALSILFIVSFNYMNLTLARSLLRTNEIGIRKVIGANTSQIRRQLLGETLIQTTIAFGIAIILAEFFSPTFNQLTGKNLNLLNLITLLFPAFILIILLVVLMSGFYPAMFLSRIKPIELIRSKFFRGNQKTFFRKIMVIMQFSLSLVLIISTFVIARQIHFMKGSNLGFDKTNKMILNLANSQYVEKHAVLKTALARIPEVETVSVSSIVPGKYSGQNPFSIKGDRARQILWMYFVDHDFIPTYGLKLIKGRNFSKDSVSDNNSAAIINETAVKRLGIGIENAVGTLIQAPSENTTYKVIGIIKDFHNESLHEDIKPLIIRSIHTDIRRTYKNPQFLTVRLKRENMFAAVSAVEQTYDRLIPNQHFDYFFIDDLYDSFYSEDAHFNKIFAYSSGLAIFLSCLGLFGLTTFIFQRKIKEIGIRKVLGASVSKILVLLSREYIKWLILANAIAWPVAYFTLHKWLQNFAYRTSINIWVFIFSALLTFLVALFTVSVQSIKAATTNPVNTLKHE